MLTELETERLTLRRPRPSDAEAIAALMEWDVARWLGTVPWPYGIDDAHAWLAGADERPWSHAVLARDSVIGIASVTGTALGYWYGKQFWGRGYATEAAGAVLDDYFARTDAESVRSGALAENRASQNVLAKLGFEVTGRSELASRSRGHSVPHIDLALTRADWERRR